MSELVRFSEGDVNNLRMYMQKKYRNNISFVTNCPIVYKDNIEYDVCNIVLSKGDIYFHCVNRLDCLDNKFIPMYDLSSDNDLKVIYKAISLTETIYELSEEESDLSQKIIDKFATFLALNNNEIIANENVRTIPNVNGHFTFTKVVCFNGSIRFYDKVSDKWIYINQLRLKDQIMLYHIFKKDVEGQLFDLICPPMIGDC